MAGKFINSCLNYTGGKYKLLPQIFPKFPKEINNFIDLFAGGGVVGINVADRYDLMSETNKRFLLNDIEPHVIQLFKYMQSTSSELILQRLEALIREYHLSDTTTYGYEHYGVDSDKGVGSYNKEKFYRLRSDYNSGAFEKGDANIAFYLLLVYGFNNQIRFNSKGEYNLPVGKRDFNRNMKSKFLAFHQAITSHNIEFRNDDFRNVTDIQEGDFIYADPPYRITTASYNENGGWGLQDDLDLFFYLDNVDEIGAKFALSNVSVHNSRGNDELLQWASRYNLHLMDYNYNNSNYQSKAKHSSTIEVLITNY
ncbi:DNA adenine methylase [Bacillus cytotoxicus]|uniref:DNA adenine methylase n=1 Tax=Bacillus cytotoxicus TaxID=580165 RepID=UPI003D7E4A2B